MNKYELEKKRMSDRGQSGSEFGPENRTKNELIKLARDKIPQESEG